MNYANQTEEKMNLHEKLFKLRSEVGKVSKDSDNPFYKSRYFDVNGLLEHIQPLLDAHKLLLTQPIEDKAVMSRLTDIESGESVVSSLTLPDIQDPQKIGSAITYYRRYTLASLLALQAEDDDGNKASGKVDKPVKQWLNATDKSGKLNKRGEQTAERLFTASTTWDIIEKAAQVSDKDKKEVDKRVMEMQQQSGG